MVDAEATVFIVDDDDAARNGLRELVESVSFNVKTFASAQQFLEAYEPETCGCLLLDVRMPGMSGLKLQDEMNRRGIALPIIFITGHGDVSMAVDALKNGAFDFVEKPIRGQFLLDKVHCAIEKHRHVCRRRERMKQIQAQQALLTDRERQILDRVKVGSGTKLIAKEFGLSRKTVDAHLTSIREKMGVESTPQLIMLLYESGLLQPAFASA
ncbi:MAG: response regulator transcription factor [Planctomycetes bacterium]|jgi:FixJ family two-component response regulator|nr:response regulator transcription factor [Planctomycetota bacterium]